MEDYGPLFWELISKFFSPKDTTYFDSYLETISLLDHHLGYQKLARHNPQIRPNPLYICAHYSLPSEILDFLITKLSYDINSVDPHLNWPQVFLATALLSVTALQGLLAVSPDLTLTSSTSQNIFHILASTTVAPCSPATTLSPLVPLLLKAIAGQIPTETLTSMLAAADNTGNTPLHLSVSLFNLPVLLTLLTLPTPPSPIALNRQGRTPLQQLLVSLGAHPQAALQLKPVADIAMSLYLLTLSSPQHKILATSGPGWLGLGSLLKSNKMGYKPQKQWLEEIGIGDINDKDWGMKPVWARNNGRGPLMDRPKVGTRWSSGMETALGRAWKTPGTEIVRRDSAGTAVMFRGKVERWADGKGGL
ncbi:hypothetical protein BJ508DRAFT_414032 [Ascobolus immersus RN42]|uniref:Ankyrin n=1 Tax=Ascobolus immersus RN42 TaxID=1160509 RepID=A0A3N4IEH8_ASCIM|nr:hypothetical protein BJ508DRAFT_414032 [Ascobolus immersus RN42]